MNTFYDSRSSCPARLFSLSLLDVPLRVRLRHPRLREASAGVGLNCLATAFMNNPGMRLVFLFELVQAFGQLFVGGNQFSQPYEGAHDMDAHVDRSWTIQHHCCHDGTMFCESIRQSPSASSPWL